MATPPIRLLLVEDNPDDAELLCEFLDMVDGLVCETTQVTRIREAVRLLEDTEFDIMLVDLSLPDSEGLDTVRRVREQSPRIPIVVLTGLNDQDISYEAARYGAQDYLVKGRVDPPALARSIRYALERGKTEQELRHHRDRLGELVAQRTADLREKTEHLEEEIAHRNRAVADRVLMATAIEHATEAFVITNAQGIIEYVNPAYERMTGYAREEMVGRPSNLLQGNEHNEELSAEFQRTIQSGQIWHVNLTSRRKDGTQLTMETNVSSVRDGAGKILKFIEVMRDVTEEIKLREQLNRSQRLESVGQLAGGLAHDFNNILQAVLGYAMLSLSEVDDSHPLHTNLTEIRQAATRAAGLTRQLLAFSRRQVLKREPIDLSHTIRDLLNMLGRLLGDDIELEYVAGHGLGAVEADLGQLEQVLVNLCVNARDAMPGGGRISIETENVLINTAYVNAHPWSRTGRFVLLSVSDTGQGMSQETLTKAFEPFFTTKAEGRGTGLGLAMVYGIIKQHDGFVHCYSEVGQGTTFKIYLPMTLRKASSVGPKLEGTTRGGNETILIVEDDTAIRTLVERILTRNGYTVHTAENGLEALRLLEGGQRVDLIVSDMVMPKLGGLELYDRLEEHPSRPPFLLTSGYTSRALDPDMASRAHLAMLQKPYGPDDLLKKVRGLLDA
jgi:two-component system cell cycle sensor histidine kinase/response regulator CckA